MITIDKATNAYEGIFDKLNPFDGLGPLFIRLIIAPVMIVAGYNKLRLSDDSAGFPEMLLANPDMVSWFGNADWGLGLPFPELLACLAGWTEFLGGWCILIGLLTRLWSIPLLFTMFIAATSVHWDNGWYAVAPSDASTSPTLFFQWLGFDSANASAENAAEVKKRLSNIRQMVEDSENSSWLTEKGNVVILNNGIEFAVVYFVMLLMLVFQGGGRYTSVDYYLKQTLFK